MKLLTLFTALGLFASGALGQAAQEPCSAKAILPCACPTGTQYVESGTWVILGTGASDVRALMVDCKFVPRRTRRFEGFCLLATTLTYAPQSLIPHGVELCPLPPRVPTTPLDLPEQSITQLL